MLSIIICTYNRAKYIYNVLQSIALNDIAYEQYEIVLVDNNCTDCTRQEVERFCSDYQYVTLRYFVESNQGLSYARNRGIQEAKGDILVYVDDDAFVNTAYLRTYADFFATHPNIDAAGGPILPEYESKEPSWMSHYTRQLITGMLHYGNQECEFPSNAYPGGGNAAYRKRVFEQIGLFNVELGRKGDSLIGAEEKDLFDKMTAIGIRFYYLPTAVLYHIIPDKKLTEEYFRKLTLSIGKSERIRTLAVSKRKFMKRIGSECIKWCGTFVLWIGFALKGQFEKGNKLILFRWNVSKGLLTKHI